MEHIIILEFLTFGLDYLAMAAEKSKVRLILLTKDKNIYQNALANIADNLDIIELDTLNIDKVLSIIAELLNKIKIVGLINATDTYSMVALQIAKKFNFKILNEKTLVACRNKNITRQLLRNHNIKTIKSDLLSNFTNTDAIQNSYKYPFIIKDNSGTGSRDIYLCRSKQELDYNLNQIKASSLQGSILVESYICGVLYSAESITYKGQTSVIAISARTLSHEPYYKELSCTSPILFSKIKEQKIHLFIKKILSAIGYDNGFSHIEFMITNDGFELIEVNPRLGGALIGIALSKICNTNLYSAFIDLAKGIKPRILDGKLNMTTGYSMVLLYAPKAGIFSKLESSVPLSEMVGEIEVFYTINPGTEVNNLKDQRSCVAILLAKGDNSEEALYNGLSAENKITIEMS